MSQKAGKGLGIAVTVCLIGGVLAFITIGAGIDHAQRAECDPTLPGGDGAPASGHLRVVQANIPQRTQNFAGALGIATAMKPDLISLNEVPHRSRQVLTPAGYEVFRGPATRPVGQTRSTAVLWRKDRWRKVSGGRVLMVARGPQKWDAGRSATWATLEDADGGRVSIVSLHHMVNPRKFGPNRPRRRQLYRAGLIKVRNLAQVLSRSGPVWIAGDFNSRYVDNDPWGPRKVLGAIGMESTREVLEPVPAHVDYIFSAVEPVKHGTRDLQIRSDQHPLLWADYQLGGEGGSTAPSGVALSSPISSTKVPSVPGWTAEQVRNAAAVINAGRKLGLSLRGQTIGVMTAMGESSLKVLDYGDAAGPDSRGLFQQRANGAWGSYSDRMDPHISSTNFFKALMRVKGWDELEPTIAAHRTQRNADPFHYRKYWDGAVKIVAALSEVDVAAISDATGIRSEMCDEAVGGTVPIGLQGWTVPLKAPITSVFGMRRHPITGVTKLHSGTDFGAACDTVIHAANSGRVVQAGAASGYGNLVVIDHAGGTVTRYAHMEANDILVSVGDRVTAGTKIARVGSSGYSTGCHLHYEVMLDGDFTDPEPFMREHGASLG